MCLRQLKTMNDNPSQTEIDLAVKSAERDMAGMELLRPVAIDSSGVVMGVDYRTDIHDLAEDKLRERYADLELRYFDALEALGEVGDSRDLWKSTFLGLAAVVAVFAVGLFLGWLSTRLSQ